MRVILRPNDLQIGFQHLQIEAVEIYHFEDYLTKAIHESELALYIPYDASILKIINDGETGHIGIYYPRTLGIVHGLLSLGQTPECMTKRILPPFTDESVGWTVNNEREEVIEGPKREEKERLKNGSPDSLPRRLGK